MVYYYSNTNMNISKDTKSYIAKAVNNWENIKKKHFPFEKKGDYSAEFDSSIGHIHWNNPNVIWVLSTMNEEGYEGSQTQIGLTKDGKLVWEYQSHCSCNSYEDSTQIPAEFLKSDLKSYELNSLPIDWEDKIRENIKILLKN